jgi:hypothetical protein
MKCTLITLSQGKELHTIYRYTNNKPAKKEFSQDLAKLIKTNKTIGWISNSGKFIVIREVDYDYDFEKLTQTEREELFKYGKVEGVKKVKKINIYMSEVKA